MFPISELLPLAGIESISFALFFFFFFFFFFFAFFGWGGTPVAYGRSQARGRITTQLPPQPQPQQHGI